MKNAKYARYFNEAPPGAKQYIAFLFFQAVFPNDLTEEMSDQCFTEMLHELDSDDLMYLIARETDKQTRDVFVERLAFLREQSAPQRKSAEKPLPTREPPPAVRSAGRPVAQVSPPANRRVVAPVNRPAPDTRAEGAVYQFSYNARRLDREVAAWNRRWTIVWVSLLLIFFLALTCSLTIYAISKGWIRVRRWKW